MVRNLLPERILDRPFTQVPGLWQNLFPHAFETDLSSLANELNTRGARIFEKDNQLHVELPMAGLKPQDIEVTFNKGLLLVKGETAEEEQDKRRKYYRSSKRSYSYSVALPTQIDEKQEPKATYTDHGILIITLQLAKHAETKKISVKARKK